MRPVFLSPPYSGLFIGDDPKRLLDTRLPSFHWPGLLAYAAGSAAAYYSPIVPPLVGVVAATAAYAVLMNPALPAALRARRATNR